MMILTIGNYSENYDAHYCIDGDGKEHVVDVFVDGGLDKEVSRNSIIGKRIECDYIYPYLEIACGVKLLNKMDCDICGDYHDIDSIPLSCVSGDGE